MKRSSFGDRSKPKPSRKEAASKTPPDRKAAARKAAVRALEKAKRLADRAGVKLSDWEDEFLGSVATRVKTFGRAFADPEKGDPRAPLSMLQAVKLKEIVAKAKGGKTKGEGAKGDKRRSSLLKRKKSPRA